MVGLRCAQVPLLYKALYDYSATEQDDISIGAGVRAVLRPFYVHVIFPS